MSQDGGLACTFADVHLNVEHVEVIGLEDLVAPLYLGDDGGMRLSGPDHSLIYGPYRDLNEGSYAVEYRLALPEDASAEEGVVCTLRVHAYWGRNVVAELPVYRSQFDESGELTIELPFATSYARALEYLVFAGEGRDVLVRGISCRRVAG